MPRANRCFLPGYVWHITHRCHQRAFLLKFARDRRRWLRWLFETKKRFGVCVLNFAVTSNHVHLVVREHGAGEIARAIQLIASRTAQEYNRRKARKGAFWEDRYHATAIDTEGYLARCLIYIDLNMVRARAVSHPSQWSECGYCEVKGPPQRYCVVDTQALAELLGFCEMKQMQRARACWIDEALCCDTARREAFWSESLAVGSQAFVDRVRSKLGVSARYRSVYESRDIHFLREPAEAYCVDSGSNMDVLSDESATNSEKMLFVFEGCAGPTPYSSSYVNVVLASARSRSFN